MPLQKNQVLTLTIERLSNDGSGVAHSPDGEAVFIPGTAPGDVAAIRIVKLSQPFAPLPSTNDDPDILHVTRTWQFLPGGELVDQ